MYGNDSHPCLSIFHFHQVEHVLLRSSLPRTASNKVMRRVLRDELLKGQSKL